MKFSPSTVALLRNDANAFSESVIAQAKAAQALENEKKEKEQLLSIMRYAESKISSRVKDVKSIRQQEKAALMSLKEYDAAYAQFKKDGDLVKFAKDSKDHGLVALVSHNGY